MTLAKNAVETQPVIQVDTKDGEVPIRYYVTVVREHVIQLVPRRTRWEHLLGTIVTHLSLDNYCAMHNLKLVQLHAGWRAALPGEKTELF